MKCLAKRDRVIETAFVGSWSDAAKGRELLIQVVECGLVSQCDRLERNFLVRYLLSVHPEIKLYRNGRFVIRFIETNIPEVLNNGRAIGGGGRRGSFGKAYKLAHPVGIHFYFCIDCGPFQVACEVVAGNDLSVALRYPGAVARAYARAIATACTRTRAAAASAAVSYSVASSCSTTAVIVFGRAATIATTCGGSS